MNTFICKGCIDTGSDTESATRDISEAEYLPESSEPICPHCYDTVMEGRGIHVFRCYSPMWINYR